MESLVKEKWSGKRVLLTGHTGFKGAWMTLVLNRLGAEVCGVALKPHTNKDIFVKTGLIDQVNQHHIADIRDRQKLGKIVDDFQPEIIIHMAAQPLVRYSYSHPEETYGVNVMGTLNVIELSKRFSKALKAILVITTDKCYKNKEQIWSYRESDELGGHDPYSSSKACCEILVDSMRKSFFENTDDYVALASARAGNVIGGGDWSLDRLIPDIINAKLEDKVLEIRNPNAVRPWQHVLEPVYGYLLLCQKMLEEPEKYSDAWNFGPNEQDFMSVGDIVNSINAMWDGDTSSVSYAPSGLHEAGLLTLDSTKAHKLLNWQPQWTINDCLERVVEWYRGYQHKEDLVALSDAHIQEYFKGTI